LKMRSHEEALQFARKAISLDNEYQEAILFLVEAYKTEEDYDSIIHLLAEEISLESLNGILYWELAQAYNEKEVFKKALDSYQNAYNMMKDDTDFLKDYGYFLVEEGRIDEAVVILQSYMTIEPSDFEIQHYVERLKSQNDETLF